jgi:hypothetical protein
LREREKKKKHEIPDGDAYDMVAVPNDNRYST